MSEAYRDLPARCPACASMMEARILEGCTVDVCPSCRGLWVDWFDGELLDVARQTGPLSHREPVAFDPRNAPCPRCLRAMTFGNAEGPATLLLCCGECGGTFVPRAAFADLLSSAMGDVSDLEPEPEGAFARLVRVLRSMLA